MLSKVLFQATKLGPIPNQSDLRSCIHIPCPTEVLDHLWKLAPIANMVQTKPTHRHSIESLKPSFFPSSTT